MQSKSVIAIIVALVVLLLVSSTLYIVPATHRAVVLRFGSVVEADVKPGLHVKAPLIDKVRQYDVRVLTLDLPTHEYLTAEKKPLDVDSYVVWQISNVLQFYKATGGDELQAVQLLSARIDNGLRDQFGIRTMHEVVSGERDQLMTELTKQVDKLTEQEFGIRVVDIRIKAIDLPKQVSENVFKRMRTERQKEAQQHRSSGQEMAEGIRADADRQRTVILATAYAKSQELRGEGDQQASEIYAKAYGKDPEFYRFFKSLQAYEKTFANKHDTLVLDGDSDFMRYFNDLLGKGVKAAPAR